MSWNHAEGEWPRRISLVSLIQYSGKNAVFLPLKNVLPLVSNCLDDHRYHVQMAVWLGLARDGSGLQQRGHEIPGGSRGEDKHASLFAGYRATER